MAVDGPRQRRLLGEHDGVRPGGDGDRVHVPLSQRGKGERIRDRLRATRQQLARAPKKQQPGEAERDDLQMPRAHAVSGGGAVSGRYVCCVIRRRRQSLRLPATITSTGTPMMLPYFTKSCFVALVNTSRGGERFLDRIVISASS